MSFKKQIETGAALLDVKIPNWVAKQDLEMLDISHACLCVVGQSCGMRSSQDYWDRMMEWFPSQDQFQAGYDHGFSVEGCSDEDLAQLTDEWKAYITERMEQKDEK